MSDWRIRIADFGLGLFVAGFVGGMIVTAIILIFDKWVGRGLDIVLFSFMGTLWAGILLVILAFAMGGRW